MRQAILTGVLVGALSLLIGCDREQPAVAPPPGTTPGATTMTAATAPSSPVDPMGSGLQSAGRQAAADPRATLDRATTGARDAAERTRDGATNAASTAQTQATATAQMTSDEAKKLIDQAMTYVKENKYDLAEKTLNQVEANKAVLPKAMQDQLATVRTALTTAKAGGGLQLPGFGGGGTK